MSNSDWDKSTVRSDVSSFPVKRRYRSDQIQDGLPDRLYELTKNRYNCYSNGPFMVTIEKFLLILRIKIKIKILNRKALA